MKHNALRTPRLILRELRLEDCEALNAIESQAEVTRYMSFDPQSPEQTRVYIEAAIAEQSKNPRGSFDFAIVPAPDGGGGSLIGRCGLGVSRPEHREAMVWYLLHPGQRGRGYAVEAVSALLDFAFGELKLHRVWADCDPRNGPSRRVAERVGMTLEGQLRENYYLKGEWCSTAVYGILESEWRAVRAL